MFGLSVNMSCGNGVLHIPHGSDSKSLFDISIEYKLLKLAMSGGRDLRLLCETLSDCKAVRLPNFGSETRTFSDMSRCSSAVHPPTHS
mmetsp:Transcript_31183/g.50653  ORF Transcript_31183/g.50653 Transcript_31183/m.50653 type:complete len:88 (-) Transcript_31183:42-305(-)